MDRIRALDPLYSGAWPISEWTRNEFIGEIQVWGPWWINFETRPRAITSLLELYLLKRSGGGKFLITLVEQYD
jgi:hypothetical protein